jgi:1-phosphofructokinase
VVLAANELRSKGVGTVLVSLGPSGAVLVTDGQAFHSESGVIVPRSTVGAGDALLAGFLAAGGEGPEALAEGVAWGAAACVLPGTAVPGPGDLRRDLVQTHPVDPQRRLALDDDRRRSTHA